MLRPFLFIGMGGSGGKTLRTLRHDLEGRLDQIGWQGGFPRAWQFVHIDVPTHPDGDDPELPPQLPTEDYVGLVGTDITYPILDDALVSGASSNLEVREAVAGWRPRPQHVSVNVEKGAGQYRTLGRIIAVTRAGRIRRSLDDAIAGLQHPDVNAELLQLGKTFGVAQSANPPSPMPIIVSSLAGGSGAGGFLDVADILRAVGNSWGDSSLAFLFAPDVFGHLPPQKRKGVQANALASISELLAGFWNDEVPNVGEIALLEKAGISVSDLSRRGPRYPFLIGAGNDEITFGSQNDVYRSVGKALGALAVSDRLQDGVDAYALGNYAQGAAMTDTLPLKRPGQELPFSAVGFARVSLGRDRFARYAAERLARGAVDRLLRHHLDVASGAARDNDALAVEQIAEGAFGNFLAESRLDERGEERNEILDALRPTGRDIRMIDTLDEVHRAVTAGFNNAADPPVWAARIDSELAQRRVGFLDAERVGRTDRTRSWVTGIQSHLTELVATSVARQGIPVTEELLGRLEMALGEVLGELPAEAETRRSWSAGGGDAVNGAFTGAGGQAITPDNPMIEDAIKRGLEALEYRAEAELREFAVEIIDDLVDNLIGPLRRSLADARTTLHAAETHKVDGRPPVVTTWPDGGRVPKRLEPAPNEYLVDPIDDFPTVIEDLLKRTLALPGSADAERRAVTELILGATAEATASAGATVTTNAGNPGESGQVALGLDATWVPRRGELQEPDQAAQPARPADMIGADALLDRARAWVGRPDTPLGRYVAETLGRHLDDQKVPAGELAGRLDRFESAFVKAVDASAPLVKVDKAVLMKTHDTDTPSFALTFTQMPFHDGSEAHDTVVGVLQDKGVWEPQLDKAFGDTPMADIDIFSVTNEPYQPVVFDSLVSPIADEWAARRNDPLLREEFWRWRRSRPLTQFIPVAPVVRRAMVRGWFTAVLLGRLDGDREAVSLFVEDEGRHVGFPSPMLGAAVQESHDMLPALLESLPIALVGFAGGGQQSDALAPYGELRRLGQSAAGTDGYDHVAPVLADWILQGELAAKAPTPKPDRAGSGADGWQDRKQACLDYLADLAKRHAEEFALVDEQGPMEAASRAWELRHDIEGALDDLAAQIGHVTAESDEDWL